MLVPRFVDFTREVTGTKCPLQGLKKSNPVNHYVLYRYIKKKVPIFFKSGEKIYFWESSNELCSRKKKKLK